MKKSVKEVAIDRRMNEWGKKPFCFHIIRNQNIIFFYSWGRIIFKGEVELENKSDVYL